MQTNILKKRIMKYVLFSKLIRSVNFGRLFHGTKGLTMATEPPPKLLTPLHVPQKLLMGPGPSNCHPRVLHSLSQQMLGHLDKNFMEIMNEVKIGIKYAFQTENEMTFAVSGTGHCAMETAICNVLEPNDKLLVASPGIWGDRALNIGQRIGAKCLQLKELEEDVVQIKDLKKIMIEFQPNVVFLCHGDSSTGVLQPLLDIINFLNSFHCVTIVDSVASLGAVPIFMDKWGIDVLYSGSQKILSAPPGISPISFNSKAVKKMMSRKTPISSFYMDALLLGNYWNCDGEVVKYHHTACMSVIYGLRESLSILAIETLEKCWEKHKLCAQYLYKTLEEMGLVLFISNEVYRLPSVTTVKIPAGIDGSRIVREMEEKFGICIAGGLGTTAGKVWRIGLMGYNCNEENIKKTCAALKKCIESSKLTSSL